VECKPAQHASAVAVNNCAGTRLCCATGSRCLPRFNFARCRFQQHALLVATFVHRKALFIGPGMFEGNILSANPAIPDAFFK
jgi:hypothetical protein